MIDNNLHCVWMYRMVVWIEYCFSLLDVVVALSLAPMCATLYHHFHPASCARICSIPSVVLGDCSCVVYHGKWNSRNKFIRFTKLITDMRLTPFIIANVTVQKFIIIAGWFFFRSSVFGCTFYASSFDLFCVRPMCAPFLSLNQLWIVQISWKPTRPIRLITPAKAIKINRTKQNHKQQQQKK